MLHIARCSTRSAAAKSSTPNRWGFSDRSTGVKRPAFRGSRSARRIGAILLTLFVVAYLIGITYWRFDELNSERPLVALGALWAMGILAIVLLLRAWRMR
jgi:hypothetical protein